MTTRLTKPRVVLRTDCFRPAALTCLSSSAAYWPFANQMATPAQIAEFQRYTDGVGGVRQSHTGVSNKAMTRAGLEKQKVMIEPGVYKVRTAALNVQYHGFDDAKEDIEFTYKVKLTVPEKWLDNATPVSTLKAFFMKSYRKKFPEAPLSKLSDEEVDMAVKDDSMFMFSKRSCPTAPSSRRPSTTARMSGRWVPQTGRQWRMS